MTEPILAKKTVPTVESVLPDESVPPEEPSSSLKIACCGGGAAAKKATPSTEPAKKPVPTEKARQQMRAHVIPAPKVIDGIEYEYDADAAAWIYTHRKKERQERALLNAARRDASKRPTAFASSASASPSTVPIKKTVPPEESTGAAVYGGQIVTFRGNSGPWKSYK